MDKLIVSSSPHIRQKRNTRNIMTDVLIALLPAAVASVVLYGLAALWVIIACVVSSVGFEALYCLAMKKPVATIKDMSAAVTGTLLAFCLPPGLPIWMAVLGSFVSIIIVKQLFGGLGKNFANPAIVGRIVLMLSFAGAMSKYPIALDGYAGATPLSFNVDVTYKELLFGTIGGSLGEVCKVALLIGGLYLIVRRVITPTIPVAFLGSMVVFSLLFGQDPIFQLLSGGAILGALFMATDYVTSPATEMGKLIYGIGIGLITMLIRVYSGTDGATAEGVSFAILLFNLLTPHIDALTRTKPLGGVVADE